MHALIQSAALSCDLLTSLAYRRKAPEHVLPVLTGRNHTPCLRLACAGLGIFQPGIMYGRRRERTLLQAEALSD